MGSFFIPPGRYFGIIAKIVINNAIINNDNYRRTSGDEILFSCAYEKLSYASIETYDFPKCIVGFIPI